MWDGLKTVRYDAKVHKKKRRRPQDRRPARTVAVEAQ